MGPVEQTRRDVSSSFVGTRHVVFPNVPAPELKELQAVYAWVKPPLVPGARNVPVSQVPSLDPQNTVVNAEPVQVPPE